AGRPLRCYTPRPSGGSESVRPVHQRDSRFSGGTAGACRRVAARCAARRRQGTQVETAGLGDFQTPPALAEAVLSLLPDRRWARVLEPTCGTGTFLRAASRFGAEALGIEIQPDHAEQARRHAEVITGDIFRLDLATLPWRADGDLLVVG